MTRHKAAALAQRLAKRYQRNFYLIVEGGEFGACTGTELNTFYHGAKVLDIFTPDYTT